MVDFQFITCLAVTFNFYIRME